MLFHSQGRNAGTLPSRIPLAILPREVWACGEGVRVCRKWRSDGPEPSGGDGLSLRVKQGYRAVISHVSTDSSQDMLCGLESPFIINSFTWNKPGSMHWEWQVIHYGTLGFLFESGGLEWVMLIQMLKHSQSWVNGNLSYLSKIMLSQCKATQSSLLY